MRLGRLVFIVLGCAKNHVEAESMASQLSQSGWEMTGDLLQADVAVVHTCGFLEAARKEAEEVVGYIKKNVPDICLVMTGCFAQYVQKRELLNVDAVLGTGEFHLLPALVQAWRADSRPAPTDFCPPSGYHDAERPRPLRQGQLSSYVRISEGCDRPCTFCIIPQIRGPLKSRLPAAVYQEARDLTDRGVRELVLIAQDTTAYGRDLSPQTDLTALIKEMLSWKNIHWLRLLYAYPSEVNHELIQLLAREEKLCRYLDMPLQHVSDKILKRMKRGMGHKQVRGLLERLKKHVPDLALRTTFIVGFPGETEQDFQQILSLIDEEYFEHVGVFPYSAEPRSAAYQMTGQISNSVSEERLQRVLLAQTKIRNNKIRSCMGQQISVLIERDVQGKISARGVHQAPEVDGQVILDQYPETPGFYQAIITGAKGIDTTAELVKHEVQIPKIKKEKSRNNQYALTIK